MGEMADLWDKIFGKEVTESLATNLKWIENEQLKLLLKEAHDQMDDINAGHQTIFCSFCHGGRSYDGTGLIHDDDCILVKIRHVIHV